VSLFLYAKIFKKSLLVGNIIVAWNACSTFLYGAILSLNLNYMLPLICFSFLYTLIREWVKIIEDYEGDMKMNVRSVAIVLGKVGAVRLIYLPMFLLFVAVVGFYMMGFYAIEMFVGLSVVVVVPLVVFGWMLNRVVSLGYRRSSLQEGNVVSLIQNYMKLSMLGIVFVFILNDIINIRV